MVIAPYINLAFGEWHAPGGRPRDRPAPPLADFLVHYFGRPPTGDETKAFELLRRRKEAADATSASAPGVEGSHSEAGRSLAGNGTAPPTPIQDQSPGQAPTHNVAPGEVYERLDCVGQGTYGKVYKARNVYSNAFVALKRIRMEGEKEGFPVTAMREIKLLQGLRHKNVIRLVEMMVSTGMCAFIA
jgi:hypothetical protein